MKPEMIEDITKLVLQKLQNLESSNLKSPSKDNHEAGTVKQWNRGSEHTQASEDSGFVRFISYSEPKKHDAKESFEEKKAVPGIENPYNAEELETLMGSTPARIGVGRAGLRPKTNTWLKFRYDHAAAVDAVYGDVNESVLNSLNLFKVNTKVSDKETYIRRPDLGRKLSEEAKKMIAEKCVKAPTVQIIASDGLSSKAVEENLEDVFLSLQQSLKSLGLDSGTPFYIEKGRVAVMDEIGDLLKPKVVVLLIGERPGLVSAESMSAYLCYEPRIGTIEADRMVISNIHKGGIPPVEAGAYLGTVIQKVLKYEASGVALVQKED